jgi:hypothetical protein
MRFYNLLNNQHIFMYIFPTLVLIIMLAMGFGYVHYVRKYPPGEKRLINVIYPGIEERTAPFPLVVILIIMGTVLWGFFYTLGYGILRIKI